MRHEDIHIHVHSPDSAAVVERLTSMEKTMSELTDAIAAQQAALDGLAGRINEDVAHLQDLVAQAAATIATDQAAIDALTADAAATAQSITEATASIAASTAQIAAIDPDPTFPATPPTA